MRLTDPRLPSHGLLTRGFLILGSVGLLLGALEVVLRFAAPVRWEGPYHADLGDKVDRAFLQHSSVPGLAYELVPGLDVECWGDRVQINEQGMRDSDPFESLSDSVTCVLALGDEATFGRLVGQANTYPSVLEGLLNGQGLTPGCEFELLNLGVSGYGVADSARVLQYRGLAYDPDLILLTYRLDDPESDSQHPMKLRLNGVPWWQHFHLGRLLRQNSLESAVDEAGDGDYFEYLHSEGSPGWERVQSSFELVSRLAHHANGDPIPVVLILVPSLRGFHEWADYPYADLHARLAKAAMQNGFEVLDLRVDFERFGHERATLTGRSGLPNAEGHRQIALATRRALAELFPCLAGR